MPDERPIKKSSSSTKRRSPYPKALRELAAKAEAIEIKAEWEKLAGEWSLTLHMPNGRTRRQVTLWGEDDRRVELLANIDLAKYTFLGDYEALASYEDNYIEAIIMSSLGTLPTTLADRALRELPGIKEIDLPEGRSPDGPKPLQLTLEGASVPWKLELSSPTDAFVGLVGRTAAGPLRYRILTLKIVGLPIERHDPALRALEQVSNSLFFDMDMRYDVLIGLQRTNRPVRTHSLLSKTEEPIQFPRTNYAREPLALYWYARSAQSMPLLQYLAYYQTLEYYFPFYAHADALKRLRNELRDPRFSIDSDSHLDRILSLAAGAKIGFGNEREQLKDTLRGCMDASQLEASLTATDELEEHFTGKQRIQGVRQIAFANRQVDLRDQIADRIYDLRCRIVHTKDEADKTAVGLLLPYSSEANLLGYDIELIRLAAQKVLVANSSSLRL
jgi:hypothetical protein